MGRLRLKTASYQNFLLNRLHRTPQKTTLRPKTSMPDTPRTLIQRNPSLYRNSPHKKGSPQRRTVINSPSNTYKASPRSSMGRKTPSGSTSFKAQRLQLIRQSFKRAALSKRAIKELSNKGLDNILGSAILKNLKKRNDKQKYQNQPESPKKTSNELSMENVLVFPSRNTEDVKLGDHRPIVIDGCNVSRAYGEALSQPDVFLWRGIQLVQEFFARRGHTDITIFVPTSRANSGDPGNQRIIQELKTYGNIILTPSRFKQENCPSYASYDDRYIVQYASLYGGIIISNDNYTDLLNESSSMDETIKRRVLKFNFVGRSTLMFPMDPLGKWGPSLKEFLLF